VGGVHVEFKSFGLEKTPETAPSVHIAVVEPPDNDPPKPAVTPP
jgi:hypothetical protein